MLLTDRAYRLKDTPNELIATKLADYFAQVYNSHKCTPEFSRDSQPCEPKTKEIIEENSLKNRFRKISAADTSFSRGLDFSRGFSPHG